MIVHGLYRRLKRRLSKVPRGRPVPAEQDFALAVPFAQPAIGHSRYRIAVMIHLFHPQLAGELRTCCEAIPSPCDVLITTDTQEKADAIRSRFAEWARGSVQIRIVPNRGRDIAPKLTAFAADYASYDLVLFLHSKVSATVDWGDDWRRQILAALCGSGEVVASILTLFANDPQLGMVAPKTFSRVQPAMRWGDPAPSVALARRLGLTLDLDGTLDFPAGSMFWARPAALAPVFELGLTAEDFPEEAGQTDATLAHAVERLFYLVCEQAGYGWTKVASAHDFPADAALLSVDHRQDLDRMVELAAKRVSPTMLRRAGA